MTKVAILLAKSTLATFSNPIYSKVPDSSFPSTERFTQFVTIPAG